MDPRHAHIFTRKQFLKKFQTEFSWYSSKVRIGFFSPFLNQKKTMCKVSGLKYFDSISIKISNTSPFLIQKMARCLCLKIFENTLIKDCRKICIDFHH